MLFKLGENDVILHLQTGQLRKIDRREEIEKPKKVCVVAICLLRRRN